MHKPGDEENNHYSRHLVALLSKCVERTETTRWTYKQPQY